MVSRDLFGHRTRSNVIEGEEYAVEVLTPETLDGLRVRTANSAGEVVEFWLPKSQIGIRPLRGPHAMITIPNWLARKNGLIA
jgi:hypothetical protein